MNTFLNIAIPSFGAGIICTVMVATFLPRRRRDHFTQAAENEVYGDVPNIIAPGDIHHTGFRKQFK